MFSNNTKRDGKQFKFDGKYSNAFKCTVLIVTANAAAKTMTGTWAAPSNVGGAPISSYYFICTNTQNGWTTATATATDAYTTTSQAITYALYPGTTYSCAVQATNSYGAGPYSTATLVMAP